MSFAREKVSAFVITFNEERHIQACLDSLRFADEVIVVDSFSTDRTVEIAKGAGARVVQNPWSGYIAQKDFALKQTSHEWVVNLDADERVSPELRDSILKVLRRCAERKSGGDLGDEIAGYYVSRVVFYLGRWWRKGGWYPEYRLRFFRKSAVTWGGVEPHEKPITSGRTEKIAGEIEHYTYDNMDDQFQRLQNFSSIAARQDFERGKHASLLSIFLNPVIRALKFYLVKRGYREGVAGLIVAVAEGYYTFMKYAKLWEHQHMANKNPISQQRSKNVENA